MKEEEDEEEEECFLFCALLSLLIQDQTDPWINYH